MIRHHERLLILVIVLLIVFCLLIGIRWGCSKREECIVPILTPDDLSTKLYNIQKEQDRIKGRLKDIEGLIKNPGTLANKTAAEPMAVNGINFINQYIGRDDIEKKTIWNNTNQEGIYVVSIRLESEPIKSSLLIWTRQGLHRSVAFDVKGNTLSLIIPMHKNEFIMSDDFINIRYLAKK